MADLKKKMKLRATAIKAVDKLIVDGTNIIENFATEKIDRLNAINKTLIEKVKKVRLLDEEILLLIDDEEELEKDEEQATQYSVECTEKMDILLKFISNVYKDESSASVTSTSSTKAIRLPKIDIKRFNGQPEKWMEFLDSFTCAIHDNESISQVQKMTYLKNLVDGTAADTIAGLKISEHNYTIAFDLLKERYNNRHLQVSSHMNKLLELKPIVNLKRVEELRILFNTIETQTRSLESLGIDKNMYGPFLIPILQRKIPEELNLIISRQFKSEEECWDITLVLQAFKNELMAREKSSNNINHTERDFSASCLHAGNVPHDTPRNIGKLSCIFCNQEHKPQHCSIVSNVDARKEILKDKKRCFVCLKSGHISKNCTSRIRCHGCQNRHHLAVCQPNRTRTSHSTQETSHASHVGNGIELKPTSVLLQTADVTVTNEFGSPAQAYIMFDGGAQLSYISPTLRNKLKLKTITTQEICLKTFGGLETTERLEKVKFNIKGKTNIPVECFVKEICQPIAHQNTKIAQRTFPHLQNLRLANYNENADISIDILIGSDLYWSIVENEIIRGSDGPVAIKSKVGYILSGPTFQQPSFQSSPVLISHTLKCTAEFSEDKASLHRQIESFWEQESIIPLCENPNNVLETFNSDLRFIDSEHRYEVKMPFKDDHDLLPDNYRQCLQRFNSLKKKLSSDPVLLSSYNDILKEQLQLGVIEPVLSTDNTINPGQVHYLPHRPVLRPDKKTTKIRCVYDASSKTTAGPSLNDCLHPGPSLTETLLGVLLRFRTYRYAFISDIQKAFLQILLHPDHRDFVRFIWFKDLQHLSCDNLNDAEIAIYRLCRVLFGVTSSPFMLSSTVIAHCHKYPTDWSQKFLKSLHVDDLCSGGDNIQDTSNFYSQSQKALKDASFTLHKFESNSRELENIINTSTTDPFTKILGLTWDKINDTFIFSTRDTIALAVEKPTKRQLIQYFASIYDPLGLLNPYIVKLKVLFQSICQAKIPWDTLISDNFLHEWTLIRKDILNCSELVVDRWCCVLKDVKRVEIHGFCDATPRAYGGCVYLKVYGVDDVISCHLLTSKSKVAPVKSVTIPKLELMGAVLLSELVDRVHKEFHDFVRIDQVCCWIDSMVALHWINDVDKVSNKFVKTRVEKVRKFVLVDCWYHVESTLNPADILSRGAFMSQLIGNDLWLHGPTFIHRTSQYGAFNLKNKIIQTTNFNCCLEKKTVPDAAQTTNFICCLDKKTVPDAASNFQITHTNVIDVGRYNSFQSLLHVVGYVRRFISNLKKTIKQEKLTLDDLTVTELEEAENYLIILTQRDVETGSTYVQLSKDLRFFKDHHDILRCKGRLENAPLPYESKFPVFIPKGHFATLLIKFYHDLVFHNGVKDTLNELRTKFWIPKARKYITSIISSCRLCLLMEGLPYPYPTSPSLPSCRLSMDPAFTYTGLDYAGPVYVKDIYESSSNTYKAWIFLFTCSSTRAVVLDLVTDYSSDACVRGLKRFFSRRGVPSSILSDNGSNFIAADTQRFTSGLGVTWNFNPPASPWWGGMFERLVRSTKRCLKKALLKSKLTYEEMSTVLLEIETVLNNRPLTFCYEQPGDEVLTPNHLLFGRRLNLRAMNNLNNLETTNTRRHEYVKSIIDHFWNRWRNEYVTELREYHRAHSQRKKEITCNVNDVVLIHEDKTPRALFKVGVVEQLKPSRDGENRVALVRYINSDGRVTKILRPVNKLYQIESQNNELYLNTQEPSITFIDEENVLHKNY